MNRYAVINKYHNKKCEFDGIKFDSIKEKNYYVKLKLLQDFGKISELKCHVPFVLIETFKLEDETYRQTKYIADFTYKDENGKYHVVDVKSEATRKDKTYQLKKKLLAWRYGLVIEEV